MQPCLPESERSLLLPLLDTDSMLLLWVDVLKSVSLCTNLPQDNLLGLLSTGDGGELPISMGAERAGMFVLFAVFKSIIFYCCQLLGDQTKQQISTQTLDKKGYLNVKINIKLASILSVVYLRVNV